MQNVAISGRVPALISAIGVDMDRLKDFKRKHFQPEIILSCTRWYLRYPLSYRNLVEILDERVLSIAHTTIMRWIQAKYLNNKIEGDHTPMKGLISPGLGFGSFNTARKTIRGYEIMRMIKKEQVPAAGPTAAEQAKFIESLFGMAS